MHNCSKGSTQLKSFENYLFAFFSEQAISGLDIALIVIALVFLVGLVVIGVLVWHLYKKRNQRDPDLNQNGEQTVPLEPAANGPHLQNGDVIIVGEAVTAGPQGDVPRDPPLSHTSNGYTTGAARYPRDNSVGQSATSMTDDYPHGRNTYPCDTLNDQSVNSMSNGRHTGTPPRENFIDQSESRIHNSAPGLVATSGGRGPYAQPESARYNNGRTTYHGMPVAKPTN